MLFRSSSKISKKTTNNETNDGQYRIPTLPRSCSVRAAKKGNQLQDKWIADICKDCQGKRKLKWSNVLEKIVNGKSHDGW